ncbi:MAG: hypothetical protein V4709_06635 [Pseudomonadota bacterium]
MNAQKSGVLIAVAALAPLLVMAAQFSATPYLGKVMALPATAQEAAQLVPANPTQQPAKVLTLKKELEAADQQITATLNAKATTMGAKAEADSKAVLASRGLTMEDTETMDEKTLMSAITGMSFGDMEKIEGMSDDEAGAYMAAQMNAGRLKVKPLPKPTLSASPDEMQKVRVINEELGSHVQAAQGKAQQLDGALQALKKARDASQQAISDDETKALKGLPADTDCGELGVVVNEQKAHAIRVQFAEKHVQAADESLRNARDYSRKQKTFATDEARYADGMAAKLAGFKSEMAVTMVAANATSTQKLALGAIGTLNDATGELTMDAAGWAHAKSALAKNKPKSPCG